MKDEKTDMSHEVERMAFTNATPWHGIGDAITDPTNVDKSFAEAGLKYVAELGSVQVDGQTVEWKRSIRRSTDHKIVGIVGTDFAPLQPSEMADFLRPWVESGQATIETAGHLKEGRIAWALAKLTGSAEICDGDTIDRYLLVAQGHDGSLATRAGQTATRVVCANTLAVSLGDEGQGLVRIRHSANASAKLIDLNAAIQEAGIQWTKTADVFRRMSKFEIKSEDAVRAFARAVWRQPEPELGKKRGRTPREDRIVELFETGIGQDLTGARHTAWGLYNALSEKLTHDATSPANAANVGSRAESLAFGQSAQLLARGSELIAEILNDGGIAKTYTIDEVMGQGDAALADTNARETAQA